MKVTEIDENELPRVIISNPESMSRLIDIPEFEKSIPNNTKISTGYYKINKNVFMFIWKYKNIYGGMNSNDKNYNDAIDMIRKDFISEKIIVHTHSPIFPTVNGYLRDELKIYYN